MANPAVTYTFSNGTVADADEVNTNFSDLINSLTDGTKDLSISALTVAGTATLNGAVTLGNATGDDISFTGSLASSIPIKTDSTYNIGSTTLGLAGIYFTANSNSVRVTADASASADWTFAFPPASGTNGYGLQAASSGAHVYAPMQTVINAVSSSNYTITDTDGYRHIHVSTGASNRTVTLPTASDNTDRRITIKKTDTGAGTLIIDGEGSETIDGQTTFTMYHVNNIVTLVCDGSNWQICSMSIGGEYTPTIQSGSGGYSGLTVNAHVYTRNGSFVTLSGSVVFTATAAGTTLPLNLPISRSGTSTLDIFGGCGWTNTNLDAVYVQGQSGNSDNFEVKTTTAGSGTQTVKYSLQYNIV